MIITKTPFRMSFFGGGTDLEEYFKINGGSVISTAIDKYCYVTVRKLPGFFDFKTHLTYSEMEYVNSTDEIKHPLIRNAMRYMDIEDVRLMYDADLPARSGLGTSSSFAVGMLNAFYCMKGRYVSKNQLAKDAIYLERELCKESGGWQDQIAAAYGGFNRIDFSETGFSVKPITIAANRKKQLNDNLMLFFTGFTRFSSDIHKDNHITRNIDRLNEMKLLVDKAEIILSDENSSLNEFGRLLHESWKLKRGTSSGISTDSIDNYYNLGLQAGALGGKLLGAGGGGFLLFFVEKEKQVAVRSALKDLLYIPFNFDTEGSKVIFYSDEEG